MTQQSPPGHILRENHNSKRYMHPNAHCSTIYKSQGVEAPKRTLTEEWVEKVWYRYTAEFYSVIRRVK